MTSKNEEIHVPNSEVSNEPLTADEKSRWQSVENSLNDYISDGYYAEAAKVLRGLNKEISNGKFAGLLPNFIEALNNPKIKNEVADIKLFETINSTALSKANKHNFYLSVPKKFREPKIPAQLEWSADPKDKGLISIIKDFTSEYKIGLASILQGVLFDDKGIVGTDGQKLLFLNKVTTESKGVYCLTNDCFKKHPDGGLINTESLKYPLYRTLVQFNSEIIFQVDLLALYQYSVSLLDAGFVNPDKPMGVFLYDTSRIISFDLSIVKICCNAFLQLGFKKVDFGIRDSKQGVLISPVGEQSKVATLDCPFMLMMPLIIKNMGVDIQNLKELHAGDMYYDLNSAQAATYGVSSVYQMGVNKPKTKGNTETLKGTNPTFGLLQVPVQEYAFIAENEITDATMIWDMTPLEYMQLRSIERTGLPDHLDQRDAEEHSKIVNWAVANDIDVPGTVLNGMWDVVTESHNNKTAKNSKNPLVADTWFKMHPDKILGTPYQTTDRFNKPVTKVRGNIEGVINGINLTQNKKKLMPLTTSEAKIAQIFSDPQKKKSIEKVVARTKKDLADKAIRRVTNPELNNAELALKETYEFEDILRDYNQGISEDEIKAWVWYKRVNKGYNDERVILNPKNGWSKYIVPIAEAQNFLPTWLKKGIVCYFDGAFMPSVLYYAENIYLRQSVLLREKNTLISKYGQEQYDRQWKGLELVKPKRLTLADPDIANRLFIKPDSDFANNMQVKELSDGSVFSKKKNGIMVESGTALVSAFRQWLEKIPQSEFKKSTSFDILNFYVSKGTPSRRFDKEEKLRLLQNAKIEGDKFFAQFLAEGISREDQLNIEQVWNSKYNGYIDINYFKVPVAFTCSATFKNKPLFIRKEQREGLGFLNVHGSGCVAYDVGLGKTMTGILALAQAIEMGQCKRPLIVVPNQTYKNWLAEIQGIADGNRKSLTGLLPQYQVNDLYNLGVDYIDKLRDKKGNLLPIAENTITVVTYEGFNRLSFDDDTWDMLGKQLYDILNQGVEKDREQQQLYERVEEMMGRGVKGGMVNIEDLGIDYAIVDEAHAMKKSFTQVKGEQKGGEDDGRERSAYKIQSGQPSMTALRGFMISQYIQRKNNMRNVVLLTATPFTNNPLEIYSVLSLIGYQQLEKSGVKNIKDFFDTFIKTSYELVINAKLKPQRREVVMGFHNLIALQQLIFRFITYKTGEEAGIQRPNKIVLPLQSTLVDGVLKALPADQQISTNLSMTQTQKDYMRDVEAYVMGQRDLQDFCVNPHGVEDGEEEQDLEKGSELLIEANLDNEEKEGTRILRGLSFAKQLALSPYLYACNPNHNPTYKEYIESSPKLQYVMECIRSVKDYHEEHGEDVSGQVIYMNAGVHYFNLIKEYLVRELHYSDDEVGIIKGGISTTKKEGIKERFLAGSVKIIIGSATIKEGINLQERSTVLYNCWLDWNPTDIKQLEGRIWRFGNVFANVRIVNPLMENSIDTFIFQKLQEKTSRINEIWYRQGKTNTLNLEEFNPAELKIGLVTDPNALAELIMMEERERVQDDITSLQNQMQILTDIAEQRDVFNQNIGHIQTKVEHYKPSEGKSRNTETYFRIYKEFLEDEFSGHSYQDDTIFDTIRKAYAYVKRGQEQILTPRGLDINFDVKKLAASMQKEIDQKQEFKELTTGREAVNAKAKEIIADRIKKGYKQKTVMERVSEFAALNAQLLSEKMVYDQSPAAKEVVLKKNKKGKALENSSDKLAKVIGLREAIKRIKKRLDRLAELKKSA